MTIIPCKQGSPEWHAARLGIPTASVFDRILTPTGKRSTQAQKLAYKLVAEKVLGCPMEEITSAAMNRGTELEADAVAAYEFQTGNVTEAVGFCLSDCGRYGASPDRLIAGGGVLEVKCPLPHTHLMYLCEEGIAMDYWPQIQGQLLVTGAEWCDSISFCPGFPLDVRRTSRDEEYIVKLRDALDAFCEQLATTQARLDALMR